MMTLVNSKVTYFGFYGRGEAVRLALAVAGVKFTDERVQFKDWQELKPTAPFGTMPILTLASGAKIGQQKAILRYIGKEAGMYPSDNMEAAIVDCIMDYAEDIATKTNNEGRGLPQEEKEAKRAALFAKDGAVYKQFQLLEACVTEHGTEGFAVGKSLTIADLHIYAFVGFLVSGFFDGVPANGLDTDFPRIMSIRKTAANLPAVQNFYSELDEAYKMPPSFGPFN
eukprot:Nitzschia sp. Nitz4//scaffold261_size27179//15727//16404//NITZ4_008212-RA/size27179-processed-gene-0.5-mRNA-1//1//CDS//3329544726//3522//frame0